MSEKDNGLNWFWNTVMVLLAALAIFGGFIMLKLLRAAAPSVEKAIKNSNRIVEQNLEPEEKSTAATTTDPVLESTNQTTFVVQNIDLSSWSKLGNTGNSHPPAAEPEQPVIEPEAASAQEDVEQDADWNQDEPSEDNFSYTLEDISAGLSLDPAPKKETATPKPAAPKQPSQPKPKSSSNQTYLQGLADCASSRAFPCSWQNVNQGFKRQYWWRDPLGMVERITYAPDGSTLNRTLSTVDGVVMYYQGAFAELYFTEGQLVRIRTFPYDNPNLRDWFVIDKTGRLATCLCGMPTQNCCARSMLYREGGHRKYCELFPMDADFCTK